MLKLISPFLARNGEDQVNYHAFFCCVQFSFTGALHDGENIVHFKMGRGNSV